MLKKFILKNILFHIIHSNRAHNSATQIKLDYKKKKILILMANKIK